MRTGITSPVAVQLAGVCSCREGDAGDGPGRALETADRPVLYHPGCSARTLRRATVNHRRLRRNPGRRRVTAGTNRDSLDASLQLPVSGVESDA